MSGERERGIECTSTIGTSKPKNGTNKTRFFTRKTQGNNKIWLDAA